MKISKKELDQMKADGVNVSRAMGQQPKKEPAPKKKAPPKKAPPKKHAAMAASMDSTSAQLEAANKLLAMNGEVMREFKDSLEALKPRDPVPYTFDIKRDGEGLLERVYARPGIDGE